MQAADANRSTPWTNSVLYTTSPSGGKNKPDATLLAWKGKQDRADFYKVLQRLGLRKKNLGFIAGFGSQGYSDFENILEKVELWCTEMDSVNPEGWICATNGDVDHGHASIADVANYIADRGVPVFFLQSHFGHALPGDPHWPSSASAGLFGPGQYSSVCGRIEKCWGGYVKDDPEGTKIDPRSGTLSFPDQAMVELTYNERGTRLCDHLCGVLIIGGGTITREQAEILNFNRIYDRTLPHRDLDRYISARSAPDPETGAVTPSPLNAIFRNAEMTHAKAIATSQPFVPVPV